MKCPVCLTDLQIAERQGIEIDYCANCRGVWLDRGELDKLIERSAMETRSEPRPASQSAPKPRRPEYDDDEDDDFDRRRRKRGSFLDNLFDFLD